MFITIVLLTIYILLIFSPLAYMCNFLNYYFDCFFFLFNHIINYLFFIPILKNILIYLHFFFYKYMQFIVSINLLNHINYTTDVNIFLQYMFFITQVLFIVIITIWTRAAGPRFRVDQLIKLSYTELFIFITLFLIFVVILML